MARDSAVTIKFVSDETAAMVIFDEAHYLGNEERGFAREEVLILLPAHLQLVLLSAAVPNAEALATWISKVRVETMHIVGTERRPVPLYHEVFRCYGTCSGCSALFSAMPLGRHFFCTVHLLS